VSRLGPTADSGPRALLLALALALASLTPALKVLAWLAPPSRAESGLATESLPDRPMLSPDFAPAPAQIHPELKAILARSADDARIPVLLLPRRGGGAAASSLEQAAAEAGLSAVTRLASQRAAANFSDRNAGLFAALERAQASGMSGQARALWAAEAIAVEARPALIRELAASADLRMIAPDIVFRPERPVAVEPTAGSGVDPNAEPTPLWNIQQTRADEVWRLLGIDGSGVTVAVVDSGVDFHHPLLQSRYRGYVAGGRSQHAGNWWCSRGEDALCGAGEIYPVDGIGHGTHVLGSILGGGGLGVAPGANWIAARACGSESCSFSWIADAIQWLIGLGPARPDIINLSLGSDNPIEKLLYEPLIANTVAADILVVAATGNETNNLRAPGSFTATIGVGATTAAGKVWKNSARGLSPWFETKPNLVAPGTNITSTVPGGGLGSNSGTSMATPHVSGVAALVMQARPGLKPAEIKAILEASARPLSDRRPDPDSGYGMVDAYAAVASVMDVGRLRGRVVRLSDTQPITWAALRVATELGDPITRASVAPDDGSFKLDLPPGNYLVVAEAFGYVEQPQRISIQTGQETRIEPALASAEPMGVFEGRVDAAESGGPLRARISLEGVPFPIRSDETTGFSQRLPEGNYRLSIAKFGYRVITDSITIKAGETLHRSYRLQEAPRILLIDSDAWNYNAAIDYYRASLDRLGYVYHEHPILNEAAGPGKPGGPPMAAEMASYDLVIWASPLSSPNQVVGAWELLAYLEGGGRVFLSGQDALCTDAGRDTVGRPCNANAPPHPYLRDKLKLRVIKDFADQRGQVIGLVDGPLEGLTLTLNGPGSMNNQLTTDVVAVTERPGARLIAAYPGGEGAGVLAETCLAHRAIALGFGFEGIAGAADRDRVMARVIDALIAPPPTQGLYADLDTREQIRPAGATADYSLTLQNTGTERAAYSLTLLAGAWPAGLWEAGFTRPSAGQVSLEGCRQTRLGVRVQIPQTAPHGSDDQLALRIDAPTGAQTITLSASAPAPVLVVDGDYVRDSEQGYLSALDRLGLRYDHWELGLLQIKPRLPPTSTLLQYPMLIWFTGENLLHPDRNLGLEDQRRLATYLDAGGRLLLSSEDYLFHWGETAFSGTRLFHRDYLGVDRYVDNSGRVHSAPIAGIPGSVLEGVEACQLSRKRPEQDFSDALEPRDVPSARAAMRNSFGQTIAVQNARPGGNKTLFLGFDLGEAEQGCVDAVIARAVDWFSPMGGSSLSLVDRSGQAESRRTFAGGETLRLQLRLKHAGPTEVDDLSLHWTLPEGGSVLTASLPAGWSLMGRELSWQGGLERFGERAFTLEFRLDAALTAGLAMRSEVRITSEGVTVRRELDWRVNAADITGSSKSVPDNRRMLSFGETTRFVINVVNVGTRPLESWVVTDSLPAGLSLVPGSWLIEQGQVRQSGPQELTWQGERLPPGSGTSLSYAARVTTRDGGWMTNRARLLADADQSLWLEASVFSRPQLLLPWLGHELLRDP
jgi:uncharacterized repeat protein (TIGR01451 family)